MVEAPFEGGTWLYNQGRASFSTGVHEGKKWFRFPDAEGGQGAVGELQPNKDIAATGSTQWDWVALLSEGTKVRLRFDGDTPTMTLLRIGTFEWRPPITGRREVNPKPHELVVLKAHEEEQARIAADEEVVARSKAVQRLLSPVSFDAVSSRLTRLARRTFAAPDIPSGVITASTSTALHDAFATAVGDACAVPEKILDRMTTHVPLARFLREEAVDRHQDELDEKKRNNPRMNIVPVPAVRLCPGMLHPLSLNEEQMLRLFINAPLDMAYNLSSGLRNVVPLDVPSAQLNQLIITQRHDVLRSAYRMDDLGKPSRKVEREHRGGQLILCVKDVGDANAIQGAEFSVANRLGISSLSFNIAVSYDGWNHQGFNMNHIMGDADAMATYWKENMAIQALMAQGYSTEAVIERLPRLPVSMVDYAYWQRSIVCQGLLEPDLAVWFSDISSIHPPVVLDIPIDIPRRRAWQAVGENAFCHLSGELVQLLAEVNSQVTPFAAVTAASSLILARLSGTASVYMGTPFALRMLASLENLIGDFVNMVIFKVSCQNGTFTSLLNQSVASAVDVQRYAMAPFLMFVESVQRFYVTNDPARNQIYQTMVDVVPKDNEEPNPAMSGILDMFLFANTHRGQLWSIECTSNTTILTSQTVRSILLMMPILMRHMCRDPTAELPRSLPCPEEVQLAEEGRRLLLAHLRLQVGQLPHIVGVTAGWEAEGEPSECTALRNCRRLKAQSGLQLSADLPLAGARSQRPPTFVRREELKVQEQMARQQEQREKQRQQRQQQQQQLQREPQEPADSQPALAQSDLAEQQPATAVATDVVEAEDPTVAILAEIEERRAQVRRKLASRAAAKGRLEESRLAGEVLGLDLEPPRPNMRPRGLRR